MDGDSIDLKLERISDETLQRRDVVCSGGDLWQCESKHMHLFINLETREQKSLQADHYMRAPSLELVPITWKHQEGKVSLTGQQLGLGAIHEGLQITGLRAFPEMEIVKKETEQGRRTHYKVVLCELAQPKHYLLVAVELL